MIVDKNKIRRFALECARNPVSGLGATLTEKFGVSRQVASQHLSALRKKGWLKSSGRGRATKWEIAELRREVWTFPLNGLFENDV